ncbi:hypothetical protein DNW89_18170 [Escherichia coli]|nr:hypothetical protein [Escherichia coli]
MPTPCDIDCKESKSATVFIYSCEYLTFSVCAGQKNIAKSGAGTQNRIEVAGKKNAALFEWAAFVKAEK